MNYADALAEMLHDGTDSLWRTVSSTPDEKLQWHPGPDTRTARELLEELVMTTGYSRQLLELQKDPGMAGAADDSDKTIEELEKLHRESIEKYIDAVKAFPEDKLHEKITLPWGEMTFLQVIYYPYWNLVYHWGQISFIQTMYGDKQMY